MKKFFCIALSVLCLAHLPALCFGGFADENRYALDLARGGIIDDLVERSVYYSTKSVDAYVNPYGAPTFVATQANSCAVTAGGDVFVYYDRIYDELIPDYKHTYVWGYFTYGTYTDGVSNMFNTLYTMMGTDERGTSVDGFTSGMREYAASKNHSVNIVNATGSYNNVNMDYLKDQLKTEKPAVIFMDTFSLVTFGDLVENNGYDHIRHYTYKGLHVMYVYGYKDIVYYDAAGRVLQRDTYLYVNSGYSANSLAYLDITHYCTVDDIYIMEIF